MNHVVPAASCAADVRGAAARPAPRVRRATWRDLDALERFVAEFTVDGALLPRTREDLAVHLEGFRVVSVGGRLIGCGALHPVDGALAEIRTLVVAPPWRGGGLGSRLVEALLREARRRRVGRVFCLTRRTTFFGRLGFAFAPHEEFPEKIWRDCRFCPLQSRCDEHAMIRAVARRPVPGPVPPGAPNAPRS